MRKQTGMRWFAWLGMMACAMLLTGALEGQAQGPTTTKKAGTKSQTPAASGTTTQSSAPSSAATGETPGGAQHFQDFFEALITWLEELLSELQTIFEQLFGGGEGSGGTEGTTPPSMSALRVAQFVRG